MEISRRHRRAACLAALCLTAPVVGAAATAREADSDPILVSRASGPEGPSGGASSKHPTISRTGRFVAFASTATNLVPEDTDDVSDIFIRDLDTDELTLVSRASGDGPKGDGRSTEPRVSGDGQVVAFTSTSDTLVPGVDGGVLSPTTSNSVTTHVFARDLSTGTTVVVDQASGPDGPVGDCAAKTPSVSADGRFVAFTSCAANLDSASNGDYQVFLRDLLTSTTTVVSRKAGVDGQVASGRSGSAYVSGDGSRVAFTSYGRNLVPEGRINPRKGAAFVRDLSTHETILISRRSGPDGERSGGLSGAAGISADGQRAVFGTTGENLDRHDDGYGHDFYVRDLESHETILVSRGLRKWGKFAPADATDASISSSGRYVLFMASYDFKGSWRSRVAVRDLREKQAVPVKETASSGFPSPSAELSDNARWLAYSTGLDRWTLDESGRSDVFALAMDRSRD